MGWGHFWNQVEDTWREVEEWYGDVTDEAYSWFGIESQDGQVTYTSQRPRQPRFAKWDDVMDPNLKGPIDQEQQWYPDKTGYSIEIGAEFLGGGGQAASGTKFIGHAPECVFDSLTITQLSRSDLAEDQDNRSGFSARLVQRDFDGRPNFISGPATSLSDDGVVYREDLRLPTKSPLRGLITVGGEIEPGLPLFIVLSTYGDIGSVPGFDQIQVQVTANLLVEPVY